MTLRVSLEPSFILHTRPFRNTSLLLEIFTEKQGRISAVVRGAQGPRSKFRGLMQPFFPLLLSFSGRGELLTITDAEMHGHFLTPPNQAILGVFYIHELLLRLVHRYDPHPDLFQAYSSMLVHLTAGKPLEIELRRFEKRVLSELGYALLLDQEAVKRVPIESDLFYYFQPDIGFIETDVMMGSDGPSVFLGQSLLDFHQEDFQNPASLKDAKRLMRLALAPLLGTRPLKSRELLLQLN